MHDGLKQGELPFGQAEGSFEERRMRVEMAIARSEPDLIFEQLVRFVFHASERTGRPVTETITELAERFYCSRATIKRRIAKAIECGILRSEERKIRAGWNAANALSIDIHPVREPVHREPPSVQSEPTPVHREPPSVHSEPPLKECQVLHVSSGSSAPSDEGDDGARYFFEDEVAAVRAKANQIAPLARAHTLDDREVILKTATLWHDGAIPEDAMQQMLESYRCAKERDDPVRNGMAWLWTTMRGQCERYRLNFDALLVTTSFPSELLPVKQEQPT